MNEEVAMSIAHSLKITQELTAGYHVVDSALGWEEIISHLDMLSLIAKRNQLTYIKTEGALKEEAE